MSYDALVTRYSYTKSEMIRGCSVCLVLRSFQKIDLDEKRYQWVCESCGHKTRKKRYPKWISGPTGLRGASFDGLIIDESMWVSEMEMNPT